MTAADPARCRTALHGALGADDQRPPRRIQLRRIKGWRMPSGTIKVDRATVFGNPWIPGAPGRVRLPFVDSGGVLRELTRGLDAGLTTAEAVSTFRIWLNDASLGALPGIARDARDGKVTPPVAEGFARMRRRILDGLPDLRGYDLACWCPPGRVCHADTLLELANA